MKKKYKASRDLPKFAREYHTLSPSELTKIILSERNKELNPEAVTNWFRRHPKIHEKLQREIIAKELPELEVSETIFNNGTFEELPSIKEWILQLDARELTESYVEHKISLLKRACSGKFPKWKIDLVKDGAMSLKHPDRLTLKDAQHIISLIKAKGKDTYLLKRDLKDFLQSKGIVIGKKIVVGKPKGYGKFAKLKVEKPILRKILNYVKEKDFEIYVIDEFMYKNGTRIEATLASLIENFTEIKEKEKGIITVFDKGRRSKYPKGKPHDARLDSQLLYDIKQIIGDRKHGRIFKRRSAECAKLNREALEKFCPDLFEQYGDIMVNHFWRHMFYQYILLECDWNYTVAADLGGSTPQSVRESYGKPPDEIIKTWNEKYSITI